ncbi:hypothetical protein QUB00_06825 [Microcoleus sp. F8_C2]
MTDKDLGPEVIARLDRSQSRDGVIFVIVMWFLSRSIMAIGMQVIARIICKKPPVYGIASI